MIRRVYAAMQRHAGARRDAALRCARLIRYAYARHAYAPLRMPRCHFDADEPV